MIARLQSNTTKSCRKASSATIRFASHAKVQKLQQPPIRYRIRPSMRSDLKGSVPSSSRGSSGPAKAPMSNDADAPGAIAASSLRSSLKVTWAVAPPAPGASASAHTSRTARSTLPCGAEGSAACTAIAK